MGNPVVHQERDTRVGDEIQGLFGGWIRGHDDGRVRRERRRGKVGIVHEGDVRKEVSTGSEVELDVRSERAPEMLNRS